MQSIELKPELHQSLEQVARQQASTVTELVNQAVENYLREQQRAKLDREITSFQSMHAMLKQEYLGEWVAIDQGKLVDHDKDVASLYERVRAQYGKTSVLIRQVNEIAIEQITIRTPSVGRTSS